MEFSRIGNKVINRKKIERKIDKILKLRESGNSQSAVAEDVNIERSFISRLESIGEIRKGKKMALIGFPVANKEELTSIGKNFGIDYFLLLSEKERWGFIQNQSGLELFNKIMEILVKLRDFDLVVFLGSDMRLDLVDKLLDGKIVGIELGESPLKKDVYVEPEEIKKVLSAFS